MRSLARICAFYTFYKRVTHQLERATALGLLLLRLWVAVDFWRAGVVKIASMPATVMLFRFEYHTPLFAPVTAAYLATFIELVFPWLLGLGIGGRLAAAFLFVYNIIAVVSYPALWPHGLWAGFWGGAFTDHKVWGLMLLMIVLLGPGRLSADYLLERFALKRLGCRSSTGASEPAVK